MQGEEPICSQCGYPIHTNEHAPGCPVKKPGNDPLDPTRPELTEREVLEGGFSARGYLDAYYGPFDSEQLSQVMDWLQENRAPRIDFVVIREAFPEIREEELENAFVLSFHQRVALELLSKHPEDGLRTIDVGGGPTIYQHIAMALNAREIIHTEFLQENRREVERWIRSEEGVHDWSNYFEVIASSLSKNSRFLSSLEVMLASRDEKIRTHAEEIQVALQANATGLESFVKKRLQKVLMGDVFQPKLGLADEDRFDVVSATFAFEGAAFTKDRWQEGVRNAMALIQPGGYFSVASVRNASHYAVGESQTLPAASVNEEDFHALLEEEGMQIEFEQVLTGLDKESVGYDGMVFVLARKKALPEDRTVESAS